MRPNPLRHRLSAISYLRSTISYLIIFLLFTFTASAQVPHYINLQSMIYDMDGNITTSDAVNIIVRIVDSDNNVLFTETHSSVPIVEGAVNILIGSASPAGDLPIEVLDPSSGTKFLDILVDGTNPFDLMPLSAVPYAMYADRAMSVIDDAIESRHIKDGTIELRDMKPGMAFADITGQASETQIPSSFTTDSELRTHIDSSPAHSASAISLTGPFASFVATNVQTAVEKIDMKLSDEVINRRVAGRGTNQQLADEIADRTDADANLQRQIGSEVIGTNIQALISQGDADLQGTINDIADGRTTITKLSAVNIETTTGGITTGSVTAGTLTADTIQTSDGVDLATIGDRVDDLQGQIDEIDDIIVPIGTIIPFYDFNGRLDPPANWVYCDGRTLNIEGVGEVTLPDLSNRYLVGFGTEGGGDISPGMPPGHSTWDTSAVGNSILDDEGKWIHGVDLGHSHSANTYRATVPAHYHSGGTLSIGGGVHTHDIKVLQARIEQDPCFNPPCTTTVGGVDIAERSDLSYYSQFTGEFTDTDNPGHAHSISGSVGDSDSTDGDGAANGDSDFFATIGGTSGSNGSPTQSIQPRSVRVRYIMRIK